MPYKSAADRAAAQRRRRAERRRLTGGPPGEDPPDAPVADAVEPAVKPLPVTSAADVLVILAEALNAARSDPRATPQVRARTIGYLAAIALKALEVGDLAKQIAELKAAMGDKQ